MPDAPELTVRPTGHTPPTRPQDARTAANTPSPDARGAEPPLVAPEGISEIRPFRTSGAAVSADHLYAVKETAGSKPDFCPTCNPGACTCSTWGGPLEPLRLDAQAWQEYLARLLPRSGGYCEIRSPQCLAAAWQGRIVGNLTRDRISLHHRQPCGMGGTKRYHVRGAAGLVEQLPPLSHIALLCGSGTTGCHGWVEKNRDLALWFGWLVPRPTGQATEATDPARVVVVLPDRRRVLLSDYGTYEPAPFGPYWLQDAA